MFTSGIAPGRRARRRAAAAFAAVGALLFSSGLVMVTAPAATAGNGNGGGGSKVSICHRTSSDSHPYTFQRVATDSAAYKAHMDHRAVGGAEDKFWKSAGSWNGVEHKVGDFKPDYIEGLDAVVPADPESARSWCLNKNAPVTVALPTLDITPIACATLGEIAQPKDTDLVTYSISGGSWSGLSGDVTVTATLTEAADAFADLSGWTLSDDERSATKVVSFGAAQDCRGAVAPAAPTVVQPGCPGPGASPEPVVTLATGPEGVTYSYDKTSRTVTAKADAEHVFEAKLGDGWTRIDDHTATYVVDVEAPTGCSKEISAEAPTATANSCTEAGRLVLPNAAGDGYDWTGDTADGPGTHTVTAVAQQGFVLTGQTSWTVHVKAAGEGLDCEVTPSTPVDPSTPVTPNPEPIVVTPLSPSATEATCSADGDLVVPQQPEGVLVTQSGSAPGDVTFTFAPAEGYVFPVGTDTEVTVTVPAQLAADSEECLLGVETMKPSPKPSHKPSSTRTPVVLGTQAAVPTAVDAGLAGAPASAPTGSPLGQALVAGGLLMLVAGASLGLGRRTRGAHES